MTDHHDRMSCALDAGRQPPSQASNPGGWRAALPCPRPACCLLGWRTHYNHCHAAMILLGGCRACLPVRLCSQTKLMHHACLRA
eukprot:scaffold1305_cov248-Pinguiococcus_pyrenoidosus.AAC.11